MREQPGSHLLLNAVLVELRSLAVLPQLHARCWQRFHAAAARRGRAAGEHLLIEQLHVLGDVLAERVEALVVHAGRQPVQLQQACVSGFFKPKRSWQQKPAQTEKAKRTGPPATSPAA